MKLWSRVTEIVGGILPSWGAFSLSGLRTTFRVIGSKFFGDAPILEDTVISMDTARALYYNTQSDLSLGAHFSKPIVDLSVDFIGLPTCSTENANQDDFLNDCLHVYWADELQQMLRNCIRDSRTIVRLQQDDLTDPLMTSTEMEHCRLEVLEPERVDLEYDPKNKRLLLRAIVRHRMLMQMNEGDFPMGVLPQWKEHEVIEIVTPERFQYYDTTYHVELTDWEQPNPWGFVPFLEVFNEWDSVLQGGASDLEVAYPFIKAFHDLMSQSLQAHKYHSIPKVKFNLADVYAFIKNNFPEAVDPETGKLKAQSEISWKGREVIFLDLDEKAEFLEARSILGDSRQLADFLLDCISIASETPRWAFMIIDAGSANQANNAQTLPWVKKIFRKRTNYTAPIQQLLKMVMKVNSFPLVRPNIQWEIVRVEDQAAYNQALQQLIMGLEVAATRGIISDTTYRELLRQFIPVMKNPQQEAKDAQSNVQPLPPAGPVNQPAAQNGKGNPKEVPVGQSNVPITQGQSH